MNSRDPSPDRRYLDSIVGHLVHDLTHAPQKSEPLELTYERGHTEMSLAQALMLISASKLPTTIAQVTVSFACRDWDRACFLIAKKTELTSLAAGGRNLDPSVVGTVPLWKDSAFVAALKSQQTFKGPLERSEPHSAFINAISKSLTWPAESLIHPVVAGGRCLALLYADRKEVEAEEWSETLQVCEDAAARLAALVEERKNAKPET